MTAPKPYPLSPTARARGWNREPKFSPGYQDDGVLVLFCVHHEVLVLTPAGEQELAEAGALDALEGVAGHDLVRVHVRVPERKRRP